VGKKRTGLNALHRYLPDWDTGAVGQHVELERLIDIFDQRLIDILAKGRLTRAENEHLVLWLRCSALLRELNEFASDSGAKGLSGPERLAPHPDHLGEEVGAAGQHVELERLTAYFEGRITAAEREELQEHLSLCVRCSVLLRELHEFAADSVRQDAGAAGQHTELERLIAFDEKRVTEAEREEVLDHLNLCARCAALLHEFHEFSRDSGERGLTGPEHLEQEAWEALQRQRSSVRKEPEEFLKDVRPRLNRLLAVYRIPIDDREDIVQQALLALLYHWEKIREPEPWLFGTIKRKCLLYWRVRRQDRQNEKPVAMEDSSNQKAEGQIDLDDFLLNMSPPAEEILRYLRRVARGIVAAPDGRRGELRRSS
jgi:DNA-directed RNA polymerase specialized sigma24 family protein